MRKDEEAFATVTFALYDEAPIACQGDDDQKMIQVVRSRVVVSDNLRAEALQLSVTLARTHNAFAQVWDIQMDD